MILSDEWLIDLTEAATGTALILCKTSPETVEELSIALKLVKYPALLSASVSIIIMFQTNKLKIIMMIAISGFRRNTTLKTGMCVILIIIIIIVNIVIIISDRAPVMTSRAHKQPHIKISKW